MQKPAFRVQRPRPSIQCPASRDGENNDSGEQSPIPISLERHRNEEKDSLAKKKQEFQSRVTKGNKNSG